jgi:hypothetical protein
MSEGSPLPSVTRLGNDIVVNTDRYVWRWSTTTDLVELCGSDGKAILSHPLQSAVVVAGRDASGPGTLAGVEIDESRVRVAYEGVHGSDRLELALRFAETHYVIERVTFAPADDAAAVVRLVHFGEWQHGEAKPGGVASTCVIPGGKQDPETAIFRTGELEDVVFSIGCFGMGTGTNHQQWALPHYLVGCYNHDPDGAASSHAAVIGLGAVPAGNVLARVDRGRFSYEINVRADLWRHAPSADPVVFDEPIVVAVDRDWYTAGLAYFEALATDGFAPPRERDVPAAAFLPQYDTWGDQGARRSFLERFDEAHLREIYADFRASKLAARLFVIDDKWEGVYGSMEHDEERFPNFISLLDEIRADGHEIGIWTAFPRCEDFRALGLTEAAVLVQPDGTPYVERQRKRSWYVFDPTNPGAAAYLRSRARHLIATYHPALVKIDFGYEIPTPDLAGPHDPRFGGERLFELFLDVIVGEMKCADPNVAILYYCITPLFGANIDQCGMDDLWMSRGAYHDGFARRAVLASWCGSFGMVPYGSSGYDWRSAEEIWLDSAVLGTPGVIAPLAGDEYGDKLTPVQAARYNGIARVTRRHPRFHVEFFDAELSDPAAGPRARSWGRVEAGATVVVALRPGGDGIAHIAGLVTADLPCVVASMTDADLREADAIGVVPFGAGVVRIERRDRRAVSAVARRLSGAATSVAADFDGPALVVRCHDDRVDDPVEFVEITFSAR